MTYSDITIQDPNPIKRWLQRHRYTDALKWVESAELKRGLRILDFGAGNGELIHQIANLGFVEAWVYEPSPPLMAEAKANLADLDRVTFLDNLDSVEAVSFDYVFCLEVFEHLPDHQTIEAITQIHRLLKPSGRAVIGVPHELFLPALFKGCFRMTRRFGHFDAKPYNILASVLGHPPRLRPIIEFSPSLYYHGDHLGFDYRTLERILQKYFRLQKNGLVHFQCWALF